MCGFSVADVALLSLSLLVRSRRGRYAEMRGKAKPMQLFQAMCVVVKFENTRGCEDGLYLRIVHTQQVHRQSCMVRAKCRLYEYTRKTERLLEQL